MAVQEDLGEVQIDNKVVGTIASYEAAKVEGIVTRGGKRTIPEMLGIKDADRGVTVEIEGTRAVITIEVNIEYGVNIYEASHKLQVQVKNAVEQMTGLSVEKVNVRVNGLAVVDPTRRERE
ncbi:MAG: Asp23/Gls24 family envelope stress response protein [bacterium]